MAESEPVLIKKRRVWGLLFLFAGIWILFPLLFMPNYRLDVVEQIFMGREGIWASAKHPGLTADLLTVLSRLIGGAEWTPYLASQICVLLTLGSVWRMGKEFLTENEAALAVIALSIYAFCFQLPNTEYNNNLTMDAAWGIAAFFILKALKTDRLFYWLGAGVVLGIGLYFKYSLIILPLATVLFLLADSKARRFWKRPGPWLTTLTAFFIFLPLLLWMFKNQSTAFQYAVDQREGGGFLSHFICPLAFIGGQLILVLPILIPLIPATGFVGCREKGRVLTLEDRYLLTLILGPFLFELLWSAIGGVYVRSALGTQNWLFLTVFLLRTLRKKEGVLPLRRGIRLAVLAEIVILILSAATVLYGPYLKGRPSRCHFPGKPLAIQIERIWRDRFDSPLPWVTGNEWWPAGNVAAYGQDGARVHSGPNHSTWSADADVNAEGGIFLWDGTQDPPSDLTARFPRAEILPEILTIPYQTAAPIPPLQIRCALIPPESSPSD